MQKHFVKMPGGGTKEVNIHCSWQDAGGAAIFLHVNGRYAQKDGSPLKRSEELDILPPAQRKQAQRWWDAVGGVESAKYYKRQEDAAEAEAGDFRDALVESTEFDVALYTRKKAKGGAISAAKAWMEFFTKRPDWWGQARLIEFGDYIYELSVLEDPAAAGDEKPEADKASLGKPPGGKSGKVRKTADADEKTGASAGFDPDSLAGDAPEGEA